MGSLSEIMKLTDEHIGKTAFIKSKMFPYVIASKIAKKRYQGRIVLQDRKWHFEVLYVLDGDEAIKEIERLKQIKADRRYDLQNTDARHKFNLHSNIRNI